MNFEEMSIGQRLSYLRSFKLKISMETFGERIGMSRSGVSNLENDKRSVTAKTLKIICNIFGVNEIWLVEGHGEIFHIQEGVTLDEYAKQKGASTLELEILKEFLDIAPSEREKVIPTFKSLLSMMRNMETTEEGTLIPDSRPQSGTQNHKQQKKIKQNVELDENKLTNVESTIHACDDEDGFSSDISPEKQKEINDEVDSYRRELEDEAKGASSAIQRVRGNTG